MTTWDMCNEFQTRDTRNTQRSVRELQLASATPGCARHERPTWTLDLTVEHHRCRLDHRVVSRKSSPPRPERSAPPRTRHCINAHRRRRAHSIPRAGRSSASARRTGRLDLGTPPDQLHRQVEQFLDQIGKARRVAFAPPVVNADRSTLDVAVGGKAAAKLVIPGGASSHRQSQCSAGRAPRCRPAGPQPSGSAAGTPAPADRYSSAAAPRHPLPY